MAWVDGMAVPIGATNIDQIYAFVEFCYQSQTSWQGDHMIMATTRRFWVQISTPMRTTRKTSAKPILVIRWPTSIHGRRRHLGMPRFAPST